MIRRTGRTSQLWTNSDRAVRIHLKRHLHLTNCIHLKLYSHMQKSKMKLELGNPSEVSLIRELSVLKKSRSLRDPSTSPSWKSGSLLQKFERNRRKDEPPPVLINEYQSSERLGSISSKLKVSGALNSATNVADEGDESSEREGWVEISPEDGKHFQATHVLPHQGSQIASTEGGRMQFISELRSEGSLLHNWDTKGSPSDLVNAIKLRVAGKQGGPSSKDETLSKDHGSLESDKETSTFGSGSTRNSESDPRSIRKSNVLTGKRLHLASAAGRKVSSQDGLNWRALTLLDRVSANTAGETDELEISEIPQNGCGMPWNWSRVHTRGKSILDIAGRSVTGVPSDQLTKRLGKALSKGHLSSSEESMPMTSEFSDTSLNTDSESFPLLEHGVQSDAGSPSEGGQGEHIGPDQTDTTLLFHKNREGRYLGPSLLSIENSHHSLSEKYAPKSFPEVVGQGLITQALSNALLKGRIASIYIFHGPQGTGKSSCARLFAIALNCTSGEELKPCGSCSECLAHTFGKTSIVKEFAAGGLQGTKGMKKLIHEVTRTVSSRYRVFIVDECHSLSTNSWNAFMKVVEEASKNIVFVLCTSSLEQLPHAVISRCQKFIFSKIKENDVVNRLQMIAMQEGLEVDAEALKLVASACDGSLRDAEMMLDQLSLLGQKISLAMVQEMMGLVSDEKLVDLLDFALSADTVNTVRSLKELMVSGVEPLSLMSQLACLITSLLAGGYQIPKPKGRHKRKFFRKRHLAKEDMERLRQALKTLSEAEKQLRGSSDRTTWLTAALLQFAPDQSYLLPSSSADTSFTQSPAGFNNASMTAELNPLYTRHVELQHQQFSETASGTATEGLSIGMSSSPRASGSDLQQGASVISQKNTRNPKLKASQVASESGLTKTLSSSKSGEVDKKTWQTTLTSEFELEELWQRVLDVVHSSSLRKFLQTQGQLLSVSLCKGFAVAVLEFSQPESSSRAERSRTSIAHAFQATLGCPIDVKLQRASNGGERTRRLTLSGDQPSGSSGLWQPAWSSGDGKAYSSSMSVGKSGQHDMRSRSLHFKKEHSLEVFRGPPDYSTSQNVLHRLHSVETSAAESGRNHALPVVTSNNNALEDKLESAWVQGARDGVFFTRSSSRAGKNYQDGVGFRQNSADKNRVSLGFVIQQAEGSVDEYSQDVEFDRMNEGSSHHLRHNAGYEGTASQMVARLEEENLRLESRSGGLLCWKVNDKGLEKVKQLEGSPKKSGFLINLCPCGKSEQS